MLIGKVSSLSSVMSAKPRFNQRGISDDGFRVITITTAGPEQSVVDKAGHLWNRLWSVPEPAIVYRVPLDVYA